MDIYYEIAQKLEKLGIIINLPMEEFISKVSNIYHKYESTNYDKNQQSLFDSIPYWAKAFSYINNNLWGKDSIKVLDFGCGTGFATLQLINSELIHKVSEISCFDLSDDMLRKCEKKIGGFTLESDIIFTSDKKEIFDQMKLNKYDLIITNSLLHHIPEPKNLVKAFLNSINTKGYYICGHEPNNSFYLNDDLVKQTKRFRFYKRIIKRLNFQYIFQKTGLKQKFNIVQATNAALIDEGVINIAIPPEFLTKLIDIHVPNGFSKIQCWGELGFSRGLFKNDEVNRKISIPIYYTYSHIKDSLANDFKYWEKVKARLSSKYPDDGADFLAILSID